jgi:Bacterial Ig-like domain (group 3)
MSRAFTRALVVSTIGGLAVAPALAYAANGGSSTHASTVTTVAAPKHALGGQSILLSARVSIAPDKPSAPADDLESERKGKGGKTGKGGKGTVKKGKGGKGRGKGHRHGAETGEITFVVDGKALAPVRLSHGRALDKVQLPAGTHTATASYGGDSHYNASQSAPVTFTVS